MNITTHAMFGKTVRVLPFPPNWKTPVNESLEWKTDVLRMLDGSEQRRALRAIPRRNFDFSTLLAGEDLRFFDALIYAWQHMDFAVPVWTDIGRLTASASTGSTVLPLATALLGFRADDYLLIFEHPLNCELAQIGSVAANTITLKTALGSNWPTGTKVFPLVVGHLNAAIAQTRHTSRVAEVQLSVSTSPDITYPNIPADAATTIYDGREVITDAPNWSNAIQNDFSREFERIDAGTGPIGYYSTELMTRIARPFAWSLNSRQAIANFRARMGRLSGQAKTCWIPTWHDDFTLADSNILDKSVLTVTGTLFHSLIGVNPWRDRISVTLPNGQVRYRRVTATIPNYASNTTKLQLDSTLGTTIGVNDNPRVQLLQKCRLATDKIVIPWRTDAVATPSTAFTTVMI